MRRILKRRPSPALVISLIALFVALGGSVYAATKINGKSIKKGSIPGNRLKPHSLTGRQVNSSTLGTVPSAKNATGLAGPLASGQTLTGTFATAGHQTTGGDFTDESAISFSIPLVSAPAFNVIAPGGSSTSSCPGSAAAPTAAPGKLCLYETLNSAGNAVGEDPGDPTRFGTHLFANGVAGGTNYEIDGIWAVTAP